MNKNIALELDLLKKNYGTMEKTSVLYTENNGTIPKTIEL